MSYPDGGLITETNAEYYEGSQIENITTGITSLSCNLNAELVDAGVANNANYKIFIDYSGAGNNYALYPNEIVGAIDSAAIFTFSAPTTPGTVWGVPTVNTPYPSISGIAIWW